MKLVAPSYYSRFRCIAGVCRHSCCVGWEIDVDEEALARYRQADGAIGERLRASLDTTGDTPCFRLDEQERCPFLNDQNLCDLILALGEDSLCEICAEHPRYRNFFSDREELGLGFCCEEACRLVLSEREPMKLVTLGADKGEESPTEEEFEILRLRDHAITLAQNRSLSFSARVENLRRSFSLTMPSCSFAEWRDIFLGLERLDPVWDTYLSRLTPSDWEATVPPSLSIPMEQLLVHFIYRHASSSADAEDLRRRVAFSILSCRVILALCARHREEHGRCSLEDMAEYVRAYSSEIEYSTDNTDSLLDLLRGA